MPETPVDTDSTDEVPTTSRKREITATVIAVGVTVALGLAANIAIEKVSDRVKNKINPKKTEDE
jgi:hypothetical protein